MLNVKGEGLTPIPGTYYYHEPNKKSPFRTKRKGLGLRL